MVGTFYRAPSPETPPFVEIGSVVKKGQPLCLIEVQESPLALKRDTIFRVDTRAGGDTEAVQLSNFRFYQDRETGELVDEGERDDALGAADVVWVGGGSVANLLALWRLHGVDEAMHDAWERGAVLGGVSAGSICWHVGGTTDSFGSDLRLVDNGLALLPYGNGVHYDSEEQRRPLLHELVGRGELPMSYATDDRIGLLYEGIEPVEVVADRDIADIADVGAAPAAYRVERVGGDVVETRLPVGLV